MDEKQNISDLNDEETDWVLRFMKACAGNKLFNEPSPSKKASDRIDYNMGLLEKSLSEKHHSKEVLSMEDGDCKDSFYHIVKYL